MTDYPRFEAVKGAADAAHREYHGGRLVDLVFWLVDRRTRKRPACQAPATLDSAIGSVEVHERLPLRRPAETPQSIAAE